MKFNLKWLFWLIACCALASWLITLPALYVVAWSGFVPSTNTFEHGTFVPYWPTEVISRLLLCAVIFLLPLFVLKIRRARKIKTKVE